VVLDAAAASNGIGKAGSRRDRGIGSQRRGEATVSFPAEAVIVAARRSAISGRGREFAGVTVDALAGPVLAAVAHDAFASTGLAAVDEVILGNCVGPGGNPARVASLAAGFGIHVPGLTVDRQCGSGLSAIAFAVDRVRTGATLMLAGGVESVSTAPVRVSDGQPYGRAPFTPAGTPDPGMVEAAQAVASRFRITRERQDAYALRSHELALEARAAGRFDRELVQGSHDDGPRADFARLAPRFSRLVDGEDAYAVTAGNSSRFDDGAAAVAIVPGHLRGGAAGLRVLAHVTTGVDPSFPGLGPISAVRAVLHAAGHPLDAIVAIEIVEAFAAQALACLDELGLVDASGEVDSRVCADGGSLALGHPWGASAAVSVVRLFSRLVDGGAEAGSLGLATAAVGGGMGVAMLVEVVR
jgi:acetyl-CoA C-acetyltransferase